LKKLVFAYYHVEEFAELSNPDNYGQTPTIAQDNFISYMKISYDSASLNFNELMLNEVNTMDNRIFQIFSSYNTKQFFNVDKSSGYQTQEPFELKNLNISRDGG
jgi:hypothetical protein